MVAPAFNPSIQEAERGGSMLVWGQSGSQSKRHTIARDCFLWFLGSTNFLSILISYAFANSWIIFLFLFGFLTKTKTKPINCFLVKFSISMYILNWRWPQVKYSHPIIWWMFKTQLSDVKNFNVLKLEICTYCIPLYCKN